MANIPPPSSNSPPNSSLSPGLSANDVLERIARRPRQNGPRRIAELAQRLVPDARLHFRRSLLQDGEEVCSPALDKALFETEGVVWIRYDYRYEPSSSRIVPCVQIFLREGETADHATRARCASLVRSMAPGLHVDFLLPESGPRFSEDSFQFARDALLTQGVRKVVPIVLQGQYEPVGWNVFLESDTTRLPRSGDMGPDPLIEIALAKIEAGGERPFTVHAATEGHLQRGSTFGQQVSEFKTRLLQEAGRRGFQIKMITYTKHFGAGADGFEILVTD